MSSRRLILFDIDGTLLSSDGAAPRAFRDALVATFDTAGPIRGHAFGGKTDPQIARELMSAAGLPDERITDGLDALFDTYIRNLHREIRTVETTLFAGVEALLDGLEEQAERTTLGLLTGNIEPGAQIKLRAAGLDPGRFRVGAYGSDHAERSELPAIAVQRAEQRIGHRFSGKEIVIIGDTPNDIACGEHLGVRTVAVATGSYTREQLARCGPDHLFADLEDTGAVMEALLAT